MNSIEELLNEFSSDEALDAVYFAMKIIKLAGYLDENEKDIFEDDRVTPSDNIKNLTMKIIEYYEGKFEMDVRYFNGQMTDESFDELNSYFHEKDIAVSEDEAENALRNMQNLTTPFIRNE